MVEPGSEVKAIKVKKIRRQKVYVPKSMTTNQVVEKYGLKKGVKDWQVGFIWNPERQIYVWHILSTIREFEGDFGYRGSGKEMLIDPVHGDVFALNDWSIK